MKGNGLTLWTVDVEALERTVTVAVRGTHSPSVAQVLDALERAERQVAEAGFARQKMGASQEPVSPRPRHVCVDMCAGLSCCPGCGEGCGHCLPFVVCVTREIGCVMPAEHDGPCVPSPEPQWSTLEDISSRAEPYRLAGIAHTIRANDRNPERFRLEAEFDRQVPRSGRWRRRLTRLNRPDFALWLGDSLASQEDEGEVVWLRDSDGEAVMVRPGDIVDRSGDSYVILTAAR